MKSLQELYRIGRGPSSSHTMGPDRAARRFGAEHPDADEYMITLYGSLAKTALGHMTDKAIREALSPKPVNITIDQFTTDLPHPNTMDFIAIKDLKVVDKWRVMSIGGGAIRIEGKPHMDSPDFYKEKNFTQIKEYCEKNHLRLYEYVMQAEGPEICDYLDNVWHQMKLSIKEGLKATGILEGGLQLQRKARYLYSQKHMDESPSTKENRLVCSYAFAVSEQNAGGGIVVTAPTCGSCGVLPAVLKYMQERNGFSDKDIVKALAAAGVIGNVIKTNASISGAECGCQAEIGSACSMASAGLAELFGMDLDQIEYAAEVAMEHHLGLTCDPIMGLVQIPCIERNAVAAMRAINSVSLANFLTHTRKISFDVVVETMYETGRDLFSKYRETSEGGLAIKYNKV
ncbi:MAG TPA: L-serine ammonia-lyase, iron-sulfur-dependent, subunit alpha [Clostridia bacterium]|nr:MAG: L-serine dehydratase 2 [Firmicutes bacterium ADurb.Bin146]HOD93114.1 L-serine ammonia-lyase, iron-sulfur-dependent, subunit alpha [Clostridia bacterium]HQM39089.1 L-serine ammonia-lyase, iron-sulfur-dependent, subunit alpha [Clostridia bacterium]